MGTLYDSSGANITARKIARQMGMTPLSSTDVRHHCVQHKLAHTCGTGTRYDEDINACVPRRGVCPEKFSLSLETGRCVANAVEPSEQPVHCGPGTVLNPQDRSCRPDCGAQSEWNPRSHQCERPCDGDNIEHIVCGPKDKEVVNCAFK